jgi:YgiT-type zinc finger domain-containing protein
MKCECKEWIPTEIDYKISDWEGRSITLKNVPAQSCPKCNSVRVDSDDLLKAEQKELAAEIGITPIELSVLLLLEAPAQYAKYPHRINDRYRMNKMLFYLWKRLEEKGFGDSWIHDVFESKKRGPVPAHLNETVASLKQHNLVKVQDGGRIAEKPFIYELSPEGQKAAAGVWARTPDDFKQVIKAVKEDLMFLDTMQLMHKVHKEYPDYRATYKEPDTDG